MPTEFSINEVVKLLNNPNILIYFGIVIGSQIIYGLWKYLRQKSISQRRKAQGLPDSVLINHTKNLAYRRVEALIQSGLLLGSIIIVPFVLVWMSDSKKDQGGLAIAFLLLLAWIMFNTTDVVKAFLGGLSFKTIAAFKQPFQIGDRVTLRGIHGQVISFDAFFVILQTLNDDRISIPTHTLWSEVLSSANAGDRSSLCVMNFYLASFITAEQRQTAEDAIWDAIQASVYYEPSKPMQIYLTQTSNAIQITAKAYVASTYNEPLFTSDVTRAFLNSISQQEIALAPSSREIISFYSDLAPKKVDGSSQN
ncbi:mechanosensitive ion channel domain-containing protein [Pleurocapsa sp. PCC 7319]|uniref:mechanosensitive ion channel domain-containing protein n=1 Tax=Pleurocapsa sp. PCC 7319 TaxID=118161 RepID=UPI000349CEFF|nr:mechanosensitive ion channel domain-containing protein [Pleurocapsa sp. PCC 7319]